MSVDFMIATEIQKALERIEAVRSVNSTMPYETLIPFPLSSEQIESMRAKGITIVPRIEDGLVTGAKLWVPAKTAELRNRYKELLEKYVALFNSTTGRFLPIAVADRSEKSAGTARPSLQTMGFTDEEENILFEMWLTARRKS